ncbi:MAG: alpha/beta hydrolase [Methanoregula sp.]|nr:alpha/beta hydrolase [Methanoregula sp.]
MIFSLDDELLLISGTHSFLLVAKISTRFALCIETPVDEYVQGVNPEDLVVVSAPGGGAVEPAMMLIELVRAYHMPLLALEKAHPGSKRFSYVVSVGPEISTNCSIQRGTHPEQHLICSSDELAGITLKGTVQGVEISPVPAGISLQRVKCQIKTEFS